MRRTKTPADTCPHCGVKKHAHTLANTGGCPKRYPNAKAPGESFGVFEWTASGHYPASAAVKVFSSRARAQAYADRKTGNLVVRSGIY